MNDVIAMAVFRDFERASAQLNRNGSVTEPSSPTARERLAGALVALAQRLAPAVGGQRTGTPTGMATPAHA